MTLVIAVDLKRTSRDRTTPIGSLEIRKISEGAEICPAEKPLALLVPLKSSAPKLRREQACTEALSEACRVAAVTRAAFTEAGIKRHVSLAVTSQGEMAMASFGQKTPERRRPRRSGVWDIYRSRKLALVLSELTAQQPVRHQASWVPVQLLHDGKRRVQQRQQPRPKQLRSSCHFP